MSFSDYRTYTLDPKEVKKVFENQQRQIQELQKVVKQLHHDFHAERVRRMNEEFSAKLRDGLLQFTSMSFEKANAYNQLIIVAGYGSFFGFWSITKEMIPQIPAAIAVILMIISVSTFSLFEVLKMAHFQKVMNGHVDLLQNPGFKYPVSVMLERLDELQKRSRELQLSFYEQWKTVWAVTVFTGGTAALILLASVFYYFGNLLLKAIMS